MYVYIYIYIYIYIFVVVCVSVCAYVRVCVGISRIHVFARKTSMANFPDPRQYPWIRPSYSGVRRIRERSSDRRRRRRPPSSGRASVVHDSALADRSTPTTAAALCRDLIRMSAADARPRRPGYPSATTHRTLRPGHRSRPTAASATPLECFCASCVD